MSAKNNFDVFVAFAAGIAASLPKPLGIALPGMAPKNGEMSWDEALEDLAAMDSYEEEEKCCGRYPKLKDVMEKYKEPRNG